MAEQAKRSLPSPFLLPTLAWCAGIILAVHIQLPAVWLVGISIVSIIIGLVFKYKLPALILLFLMAGCFRLNITKQAQTSEIKQILAVQNSITQSCKGEIIKVLNNKHNLYQIWLTSIKEIPVKEKVIMAYDGASLKPGDRFTAIATINLNKADPILDNETSIRYLQNYKTPILLNKVHYFKALPSNSAFNPELIRYNLLQSIDKKLGSAAPFAKALLLNDRTADRDWLQQLVQGGLLHLIAISGLHVLLFYFVFVTLMNITLPRRSAELIFLLLMLFYAGLCQWSAPIMRAILMILLYIISRFMQRKVAPLQIICLSLFIITLIDPVQLFSVGLQLSYLCVLILAYAIPKRTPDNINLPLWQRWIRKSLLNIKDLVVVSVIITLALLPMMMFYFQRGSFNGIIGNILGIPFMSLLLPMTLTLVFIPAQWAIFHWLKSSFDVLHFLFQKWVAWTAGLPFYVDTVNLSLSWLIVIYLLMLVIIIRFRSGITHRKFTYFLLMIALVIGISTQFPRHKPFSVIVFNAGLGDCSLIEYPQGQTVMIDTGPKSYSRDKQSSNAWFGNKPRIWFRDKEITTIDILVLSHLDDDHRGGLNDVFRNLNVRRIIINKHDAESHLWHQLTTSIDMKEAKLTVISDTMSFTFANSRLTFLHPDAGFSNTEENANSLVVRIDYKGFSALFPGDISTETEEYLVERYPDKLDCDFLKVPHHGSRYSSSAGFIKAVSPLQACITAPLHNRFHFPDVQTLSRYRNYGIEPQLTGNGSVMVKIP